MINATFAIFCASSAAADSITCTLGPDAIPLQFDIDRNQFVNSQNPADPPRRKTTIVHFNNTQFPAEPILMGNIRGFHAEGLGDSTVMFIVQPGGQATYTGNGQTLNGTCKALN